jgi:hypothetical protein
MALILTTTTGRVDPARIEAFQVTFQTLFADRFTEVPFLRQAMLVHLGDSVWQMLTLWDSSLAQTHAADHDVPLTVRIFRDFGVEPDIHLADVSSFLQPGRRASTSSPATPARPADESPSLTSDPSDDEAT